MPRLLAPALVLLVNVSCQSVLADQHIENSHIDNQTAADAMKCAAVYYIGMSLAELLYQQTGETAAKEGFTDLQKTFEQIYTVFYEQGSNTVVTRGTTKDAKSRAAEELGRIYDDNRKKVVAIEVTCNAWRERLAPYLLRGLTDESGNIEMDPEKVKQVFRSVPAMPSTPPSSDPHWIWSHEFISVAFEAWTMGGRMTPSKAADIIRGQALEAIEAERN